MGTRYHGLGLQNHKLFNLWRYYLRIKILTLSIKKFNKYISGLYTDDDICLSLGAYPLKLKRRFRLGPSDVFKNPCFAPKQLLIHPFKDSDLLERPFEVLVNDRLCQESLTESDMFDYDF